MNTDQNLLTALDTAVEIVTGSPVPQWVKDAPSTAVNPDADMAALWDRKYGDRG